MMVEWEIMLLLEFMALIVGCMIGFVSGVKVDASDEYKREEIERIRRRRRRKRRSKYGYID